jgi:hypothetical protein
MTYITADETLLQRLSGIREPVEIRDETGRVVGHYAPAETQDIKALQEEARRLFDFDKARETLQRESGKGRPLSEIWASIKSREEPK